MNEASEEFESPEYEPLVQPLTPKVDPVKLIIKKSFCHNITASSSSRKLDEQIPKRSAYEIVNKDKSTSMDSHPDLETKKSKMTPKSRELKRLQEHFVDSKDLSDPNMNIYQNVLSRSKSVMNSTTEIENDFRSRRSRSKSKCLSESGNAEKEFTNFWTPPPKEGNDSYCWKCKKSENLVACCKCERSFHLICFKIKNKDVSENGYPCPECIALENFNKISLKAGKVPFLPDELNHLLGLALNRIKNNDLFKVFCDESYLNSVDSKHIIKRITLKKLSDEISRNHFKTTEEFAIEVKWFLHNVLIINNILSQNNKILNVAKELVKSVKRESVEIESCSECYLAANTKEDWFIEVCSKPHLIVWAKLKGFPFWPAKVMGITLQHMVNVRFFGDHDRAQIPVKDCYLYSKESPCPGLKKNNRSNLQNCISEVETHIEILRTKYESFEYAPPKTPYDPNKEIEQLQLMLPKYKELMEKQLTNKTNTGLQFKIFKTSDNNLSMTKIRAEQEATQKSPEISKKVNHKIPVPTTSMEVIIPQEASKKSNYKSVHTKVVLKRRPSGEYVVENKREKREEKRTKEGPLSPRTTLDSDLIQTPTVQSLQSPISQNQQSSTPQIQSLQTPISNSQSQILEAQNEKLVSELTNKNQSVTITKIALLNGKPPVSVTEKPLLPIIIKTEPVDDYETPAEAVTPQNIRNFLSIKKENNNRKNTNKVCRPLQQSTPIANTTTADSQPSFEMSSNMVCIPLANNSPPKSVSTQTNETPNPAGPSFPGLEDDTQKITEFFKTILKDNIEKERKRFEEEKQKMAAEIESRMRKQFEQEKVKLTAEIAATKRKQWCSNCWKESQFYCCWNTSYCSYECQTIHWIVHSVSCNNSDKPNEVNVITSSNPRLSTSSTKSASNRSNKKHDNSKYMPNKEQLSMKSLNIMKPSYSNPIFPNSVPIVRTKSTPSNIQTVNAKEMYK